VTLGPSERQRAKTEAQMTIDSASQDLEHGTVDELAWSRRVVDALAAAYLLDEDPRWQSGFDGDSQLWREARELILAPVHRDGTLLDIGCATGYLMECLHAWALERGRRLSVYGLELSPALVATGRRRLPALANHIFEGNVLDWLPDNRFTFVRTGLEYVPAARRPWLVRRLLDHFVEPDGRLIAGPVIQADLLATVDAFRDAGAHSATSEQTDRNGKTRHVVWCGVRRAVEDREAAA
jgi:SAM-dependent methyltransferase